MYSLIIIIHKTRSKNDSIIFPHTWFRLDSSSSNWSAECWSRLSAAKFKLLRNEVKDGEVISGGRILCRLEEFLNNANRDDLSNFDDPILAAPAPSDLKSEIDCDSSFKNSFDIFSEGAMESIAEEEKYVGVSEARLPSFNIGQYEGDF